jgi:hypothetical protein
LGIWFSFILITAGAILIWAVNSTSTAFNVHAAGWILFIVGIVALLPSLAFWSTWFGPGYRYDRRRAAAASVAA